MIPLQVPSTGDDYSDLATPDGRLLWTNPGMVDQKTGQPNYSTLYVGRGFFGRGERWMYLHLSLHHQLSHPEIGRLEVPRTNGKVPARRWRLYDVELFAHLMAAHYVLTGVQLARTVRAIKLNAEMWGYRL